MQPGRPQIEVLASETVRWAAAGAVTLAIAVYLALHLRAIAGAVTGALTALRG